MLIYVEECTTLSTIQYARLTFAFQLVPLRADDLPTTVGIYFRR